MAVSYPVGFKPEKKHFLSVYRRRSDPDRWLSGAEASMEDAKSVAFCAVCSTFPYIWEDSRYTSVSVRSPRNAAPLPPDPREM
jgi:hypothetical protein